MNYDNINNNFEIEFSNNIIQISNIENISDQSKDKGAVSTLFNEISEPVLNIINGDENDNTISGTMKVK